jgi:hypothetical protein
MWRCVGSTAVHWPTVVGGGAICAAIGTHGVVAGEREPAGEVVGAVISSTGEELEIVAAEVVSHCKAVWVVCERSLSGSVKLNGMGYAGSSLWGCGEQLCVGMWFLRRGERAGATVLLIPGAQLKEDRKNREDERTVGSLLAIMPML